MYKCSCCFSIDTIRSHMRYNFIRDFGWVYKWGGGGGRHISGIKKCFGMTQSNISEK